MTVLRQFYNRTGRMCVWGWGGGVLVCTLLKSRINSSRPLFLYQFDLTLQIFSKVNNILRVDLYDTNTEYDILVNEVLIDEGFAVKCEEPYQSKVTVLSSRGREGLLEKQ